MFQQTDLDVVELTQKLISIPSFVDKQHNETRLIEFLSEFFAAHVPSLAVEKQYINPSSERANLLIRGKGLPRLFVLGHIDTVQPTDSWSTKPLEPVIQNGRLYGLGAADMKGSLAAFLCAVTQVEPSHLDNLMILLYIDEEYDFAGMKRFLSDQTLSQSLPDLILSLDGALTLLSGCRGLIEFSARLKGRSGHSSNPANGSNAITGAVKATDALEARIQDYRDPYLGNSTLNVAYLQGGVLEHQDGQEEWLREGNVIPDRADITIELRTAHAELDADKARTLFAEEVAKQNLTIEQLEVRHNYGIWPVAYDSNKVDFLEKCYEISNLPFHKSDRLKSGFIDVQMITELVDSPTFVIGAGGENKHGADENVAIDDLTKAMNLYKVILINSKRAE